MYVGAFINHTPIDKCFAHVSMFRLLVLFCFGCFAGALPVSISGYSFEHDLNLKITKSYVNVAPVQTPKCPPLPLEFVETASFVRWTNILKKEFLIEIPFKSMKDVSKVYVEVEAIYDAKPYVFWENSFLIRSPLRISISSPANIHKGKPLWVIVKISLNNCVFSDVYTRLEIE